MCWARGFESQKRYFLTGMKKPFFLKDCLETVVEISLSIKICFEIIYKTLFKGMLENIKTNFNQTNMNSLE